MRFVPLVTAGVLMLAANAPSQAMPLSPAGLARGAPAITLVQDKPKKSEPLTQKVKRAWKDLVGYKFDVACLGARTICSETGDSRGAAQAKCMSRHPLCWVSAAE